MYTVDITMVITMNLSMCVAVLAVLLVLRCSESMKLHDLTTVEPLSYIHHLTFSGIIGI